MLPSPSRCYMHETYRHPFEQLFPLENRRNAFRTPGNHESLNSFHNYAISMYHAYAFCAAVFYFSFLFFVHPCSWPWDEREFCFFDTAVKQSIPTPVGKPIFNLKFFLFIWIIPTPAGWTLRITLFGRVLTNHSHACGMNFSACSWAICWSESFPHLWDKQCISGRPARYLPNHSHTYGMNIDTGMKVCVPSESFPRLWDKLYLWSGNEGNWRIIPTPVG